MGRAALLAAPLAAAAAAHTLRLQSGEAVDDARHSLSAGRGGPLLLRDRLLVQRLQAMNREHLPPRTVHARGALAKGYFSPQGNFSHLTIGKVFWGGGTGPGQVPGPDEQYPPIIPIAARWSTTVGGADSAEAVRDPRGFAVRFYTEEGNYDLVGLNWPVFFIRDALRFPELVRAFRPHPQRGIAEWRRIMDFLASYPESVHALTFLLDDGGIPANHRQMDGHGVHTYVWVNGTGKRTWVRYHWQSWQGAAHLLDEQAAAAPYGSAKRDLYDSIASGNSTFCLSGCVNSTKCFPWWGVTGRERCAGWNLAAQFLDPDDDAAVAALGFDPLDPTKEWPSSIKLNTLGYMVLNENPASQFADGEQAAFSPANLVPGIELSDDHLLQARSFAYHDAALHRVGANYNMLPVNRPRGECPFAAFPGGAMNLGGDAGGGTNYFPSMAHPAAAEEAPRRPHAHSAVSGRTGREEIPAGDDYAQPGARVAKFDAPRRARFAARAACALSGVTAPAVLQAWLGPAGHWRRTDSGLADLINASLASAPSGCDAFFRASATSA